MKFRDYFSLKHILFAISLIAVMMFFAVRQSNNMVKVYFEDTQMEVVSSKYSMAIPYDIIASAELADLAEPGEKVESGWDDDLLRSGKWVNDTWGEYYICADLDTSNCIVMELNDGRIFVISRKNDKTTAEIYETLLTYLNS